LNAAALERNIINKITLRSVTTTKLIRDNIIAPLKKMKVPIIKAETSQNWKSPLN